LLNSEAKARHYLVAVLAVLGISVLFSLMDHKPVDVEGISVEATSVLILGG
jgi:hypothetical protein